MKRSQLVIAGSYAQCADAFVGVVAEQRARGDYGPVVALVGSHQARRELQRQLHRRLGGMLGVWLLTFRDLADRLGRTAPALAGRREADPLYQQALLARLLHERPRGRWRDLAERDGLAAALLRTLTDLEEAGCARWPAAVPRTGALAEIAAVFDAYRDELTASHYSAPDLLAAAADRAVDFPALLATRCLHVVGIYDVNPRQRRLLEALDAVVNIRYYAPQVWEPPTFLAQAGLSAPAVFQPDPHTTRIWSCPTEMVEARAIVREARRCQREGVPYHRMAVLTCAPEIYGPLIDDLARRAGLPCCVTGGVTPRASGSLRALGRLVGLLSSRRRRSEVMALLHAVDLPPSFGPAAVSQSRWDRVSRLARVRTEEDWDHRLGDFAKREDQDQADRTAATHLAEVVHGLLADLRTVGQARTYRTAADRLGALARRLIAGDHWLDLALESWQRLRLLDEAGLPFALSTFQTRVTEMIRAVREDVDDPQGLVVLDFVAARGLCFDVVFIPGCVESILPAPPRQDPFLLDDERTAFGEAIGDPTALPTRADRAREERRLFDLACRAATGRLILSYPRLDVAKDGRPRLPSHLLLALAERIVGKSLSFDDLPRQSPLVKVFPAGRFAPDDPALALDDDERDLALMDRLAAAEATLPVRYLLQARAGAFPRVWTKWVHRWAREELTEHDGLCAGDPAQAALAAYLAAKDSWSVSEIEDYVCCPRRHLLEKILNLTAPEDPEQLLALPPDKRGSLLHNAWEQYFDPANPSPSLAQIIRSAYADLVRDNYTGGGVLDEVEVERLIASAQALVDFAGEIAAGHRVEATEKKAIAVIDADGRKVLLKARFDRVDRDPDGRPSIVDYKTGQAKNKLTTGKLDPDSFNGGATLQLPLYLLAYAATHPQVRLQDLTAAYWYLHREQNEASPKAVTIQGAFVAEKLAVLRRVLREVVEGIENGRFVPRPDIAGQPGNKFCSSCSGKTLCDPRSRVLLGLRADRAGCCRWVDAVGRVNG